MGDLKEAIIYRCIYQESVKGITAFHSPTIGTTITFGSSSFYYHMKYSSHGTRNINDTLSRFNASAHAHEILTDPSSVNLGLTRGDHYTFTTITDSESDIRITLKDNDVYSVRHN